MGKLINEVSWSNSSAGTLEGCRRQYYFNKYLSWDGWFNNSDPKRKEAYQLKNMTSLPMWLGTIVHDCIEHAFAVYQSDGKLPTLKSLKDLATHDLRLGWTQSEKAEWREFPKLKVRLLEHQRGDKVSKANTDAAKNKIFLCLETFYKLCDVILKDVESFIELEDLHYFHLKTGEKVFLKMDCGIKYKDGRVLLIDWKTSKKRDDSVYDQLAVYAMYVMSKYKIKLKDIQVSPVYLTIESFMECKSVNLQQINEIVRRVKSDTANMIVLHPHGEALDISKFPVTSQDWRCKFCFFQGICDKPKGN